MVSYIICFNKQNQTFLTRMLNFNFNFASLDTTEKVFFCKIGDKGTKLTK